LRSLSLLEQLNGDDRKYRLQDKKANTDTEDEIVNEIVIDIGIVIDTESETVTDYNKTKSKTKSKCKTVCDGKGIKRKQELK